MSREKGLSIVVWALAVHLGGGGLAGGQEPPAETTLPDPVLEDLVAEALERSPDLQALREAAAAAGTRSDQAGALADPMVSVAYTNDGWSPSLGESVMSNLAFKVAQPVPWPGKRSARAALAATDAATAAQQLERGRLAVGAAVRRAYYGLILARETLELVDEQEATARDVERVARSRYAVGQGAQQDVLRAQVEVTRIEELRALQEAEAEVRLAEVNRLLARPPDAPLETSARLALVPERRPLEAVQAFSEERSPELRAAAVALERDRLARDLADRAGQPDLVLQAGYMNRGGLDPMWQAGIGVTLPLWRKRIDAERAEAEIRQRSTERRRDSLRLQLRYRNQERLARLRATERTVRLYESGIVPQDRMSVESAVASYQVGKVPFVAVLEALTTLYRDRVTLKRLLARHAQLRAGLAEMSLDEAPALAVD
jgi:cobalt-zinc-cadmium efflux system outer membrane protein